MKINLNEEVTYIRLKPGSDKRLLKPEELYLKDCQNNKLVETKDPVIVKTVQSVLSSLWK